MKNRIFGYARVSTKDQNLDRQIKSLIEHGIDERNIITDTCTGVNFRRNGYNALSKVLLKKGDILVISSIDRLGRNKKHLNVSAYMADLEYKKIKKRQRQGIDAMPIDEKGKKYSTKTGRNIGRIQ